MLLFVLVFRGTLNTQVARVWFGIFFEVGVCLSLAAIIWTHDRWIAGFLILAIVSSFAIQYDMNSYFALRAIVTGCLWYLFVVMFFTKDNLYILYRVMRACAYFHTGVAFMQFIGHGGWFSYTQTTGLMATNVFLSALLCFCLPAFLELKGKRILLILIPIAGIMMAKQFLGIISLGAGVIFYLSMAHRIYWPIVLVIPAVIAWAFFVDTPGVDHRLYVWGKAIRAWWNKPLVGFGIGHWKGVFKVPMNIDGTRWMTTHNEHLQMLFELGVGVVPIFIGYYAKVLRSFRRELVIPLTALLIISIQSFGTFAMHIAPTAILAVTWLAILTISTKKEAI